MTRSELLELAVLDVFGLLDEYEAALYTRAFHAAPATVQDEIYELQGRIAADESLLPAGEPPDELRRRVLEFVAAAIEKESPAHAPLATIGSKRAAELSEPLSEPPDRHRSAIVGTISRHFWRAATFMLCAVVIAMAYFFADTTSRHHELTRMFLHDNTNAQIEQRIGPTFKDFLFDPATRYVYLTPVEGMKGRPNAMVALREGGTTAMLVIDGLPWDEGYELQVRDADGRVHHVATLDSYERLGGYQIELTRDLLLAAGTPGFRWEIAFEGEVLMASA